VPPGLPIDLTATVPAARKVTLCCSTVRRRGELHQPAMVRAGRAARRADPAPRVMTGVLHYYIEARDDGGNLAARAGKPIAPNVVTSKPTPSRT